MSEVIDAVIMWVDGNDPSHIHKRKQYMDISEADITECATLEGRFIDTGEVKYCIYSIRKFAPWIRNIFLVTDGQCPSWLTDKRKKELNVQVIDHKVIFRDNLDYLPTFNSMSLLTLLWKIPGLSNKYISFNDDTFLINYVTPEDFFVDDRVILRGKWEIQRMALKKKIKWLVKQFLIKKSFTKMEWSIGNPHVVGAQLTGFKQLFFETSHAAHTWRVDVQKEFYNLHPELILMNAKYKFRNKKQFGPDSIFAHLMIKSGKVIEHDGSDAALIIPRIGGLKDNLGKFHDLANGTKKFLCFQDLFFLQRENPGEYGEVVNYLNETILS